MWGDHHCLWVGGLSLSLGVVICGHWVVFMALYEGWLSLVGGGARLCVLHIIHEWGGADICGQVVCEQVVHGQVVYRWVFHGQYFSVPHRF